MMSPDRMRRVDYWLGIPLCFLLTCVRRLGPLMPWGRPRPQQPANVLFIELAEMGSFVLAAPAVARLRSRYPGCRVFFLVFKQIEQGAKVLKLTPDAHVITIDASNVVTLIRDTLRFVATARRLRIDTTINLEAFARFSTILAAVSGATRRVGFHRFSSEGLYTGRLLTHEVSYNPHCHTAQSFLTLVAALSEPGEHIPLGKVPLDEDLRLPRVEPSLEILSRVQALIRCDDDTSCEPTTLVLVNPNASKLIELRRWPLEHYAELIGRLVQHPDIVVGITGVASEREDARFIVDAVRSPRVVDLAGKTSLDELIGLYHLADLLITNDSGPAHFAALTDIDVIVFFGPETPVLYRPLTSRCAVMHSALACSPCVSAFNQRVSPCNNNVCLKSIAAETVYAKCLEILGARRLRRTHPASSF